MFKPSKLLSLILRCAKLKLHDEYFYFGLIFLSFKRLNDLLGDSSSVVSVIGGVVTVDDDWWCEWWFLWCDNMRCDWWWCEWECELFELVELVEGCDGGGNPCDFVIVNSPFDVVSLYIAKEQTKTSNIFRFNKFKFTKLKTKKKVGYRFVKCVFRTC